MEMNTVQKFVLLAQHPTKGRFITPNTNLHCAIIGAILLEFSFREILELKRGRLLLKKEGIYSDPMFAKVSELLNCVEKPRKIRYWINKLSGHSKDFKQMILEDFEKNNVIKFVDTKILGLFPYQKHFLVAHHIRNDLIQQLKINILFHHALNQENFGVLGLVRACNMHKIFSSNRNELKVIKKSLTELLEESPVASAVDNTIKEIQAAIVGGVAASTVAVSAGGSN